MLRSARRLWAQPTSVHATWRQAQNSRQRFTDHGELLKLEIDVCQATVAKYMVRPRQRRRKPGTHSCGITLARSWRPISSKNEQGRRARRCRGLPGTTNWRRAHSDRAGERADGRPDGLSGRDRQNTSCHPSILRRASAARRFCRARRFPRRKCQRNHCLALDVR
jgi:hypothetical protein